MAPSFHWLLLKFENPVLPVSVQLLPPAAKSPFVTRLALADALTASRAMAQNSFS
jgi:hypothetical protein